MWEYWCEHSPIWARSTDLDVGQLDARELGLPEDLRDDLADWNRRCEAAADPDDLLDRPPTAAESRATGVEAFALAARVQRALGAAWTVWCLAGGGDGGMREPGAFRYLQRSSGPQVLLRDGGPVDWTPTHVAPALDDFAPALRREALVWRASADRLEPAEFRARALELAGRLHGALEHGRVLWFGGGDVSA
ncbi:hypothetical protein CLV52_1264 [Amnibacterium kyonggiense]|uniref:Uncharacterized protein n=2 Tax=Amnibacterium kyonggiense TaxID=595671 RepID=A0A4R7FS72_9MICO|nr:hypothetical protein CLV52_1264 [Amnibacterium kyonggiense]